MRTKFYALTFPLIIIQMIIFCAIIKAEGTKEFRPDSAYYGCMQINDIGRPFALESNTDPLHRLYFHIKDYVNEKVYFGFKHIKIGTETATYRIKDPNGNVVYPTTSPYRRAIPTSGTGYIKYYANAVAGPKISTLPANGYTPIVFTPAMNGDFYIEFTTTATEKYLFDLFDLTIATSTSNRIKGRLWSNCWDLNTQSYTNRYWGKFYNYTTDGYVSEFNMNGIQPYGFTVSCNNYGVYDSLMNDENRKSVNGNHAVPLYKIFLNEPDIACYPSGETPVIMENLALVDTPFVGSPAKFTVKMSKSGTIEMVIDLNGTPGYQPNSEDVVLVQTVNEDEKDTIVWDGIDGLGNPVNTERVVVTSADFYSGLVHFPLYDPETNEYGYIVNRIRPVGGACKIYWDDSNFPDGTTNITGQYGPAHTWPYFFGDVRTMNTWWDGFRIDTMAIFEWSFREPEPMPVEFLEIKAAADDNHVDVIWSTASETNNDYFTVERSANGMDFITISVFDGAGNSNVVITYEYSDDNPISGISYYRIKQTDFDGKFAYSEIKAVRYSDEDSEYSVYPNPIERGENLQIIRSNVTNENFTVSVFSYIGQKIDEYPASGSFSIPVGESFKKGVYYVILASSEKTFSEKIIVQ
jgi:hypothetical protein